MPNLVSMKMSPAEAKKSYEPTMMTDKPEYPYGLCIHLNEESIAKLGLKSLPDAGETLLLMAKVQVSSVSMRDTQEGQDRCLDLQITELALAEDKTQKSAEETLYGG